MEVVEEHDFVPDYEEEVVEEPGTKRRRVEKFLPCPLCPKRVFKPRNHVLRTHLPWFLSPSTACFACKSQFTKPSTLAKHFSLSPCGTSGRFDDHFHFAWITLINSFLLFLCSSLSLSSPNDLLPFVLTSSLLPPPPVGSLDSSLLTLFCSLQDLPVPSSFTLSPPNHLACLLHWRMMALIISKLPSHLLSSISSFGEGALPICHRVSPEVSSSPSSSSLPASLIDSHFHLDKLLRVSSLKNISEIQSLFSTEIPLSAAISNFCFPEHWPWFKTNDIFLDNNIIYSSFGIHPSKAHLCSSQILSQLTSFLNHPRCVALGEIGLNYHPNISNHRKNSQKSCLRKLLRIAITYDLPIIIHCRDYVGHSAEADCLSILKEIVPSHHKIHRHCFTGNLSQIHSWLDFFPNTVFGLTCTPLLFNKPSPDVIRAIPIHKFLLESDAPYLVPPSFKSQFTFSTPSMISEIARYLADVFNKPLFEFLHTVKNNTTEFYGLPEHK